MAVARFSRRNLLGSRASPPFHANRVDVPQIELLADSASQPRLLSILIFKRRTVIVIGMKVVIWLERRGLGGAILRVILAACLTARLHAACFLLACLAAVHLAVALAAIAAAHLAGCVTAAHLAGCLTAAHLAADLAIIDAARWKQR